MKGTLAEELDFINEANNSERCKKDLAKFKFITVPSIHWDKTTKVSWTCRAILRISFIKNKWLSVHIIYCWLDGLWLANCGWILTHKGLVTATSIWCYILSTVVIPSRGIGLHIFLYAYYIYIIGFCMYSCMLMPVNPAILWYVCVGVLQL